MIPLQRRALAGLCAALLATSIGCFRTPIRVDRVSAETALNELTASALSHGEPSDASRIVLRSHGLEARFAADPAAALAELRTDVVNHPHSDELFALAELSFLHARRNRSRPYYLAAALYAYAAVVPGDEAGLDPFDPRLRLACDLYNVALTEAFKSAKGEYLELRGGDLPLPFGSLHVDVDESSLWWGGRLLVDLVPVTELEVHGLNNRHRQAGIGVPIAARTVVGDAEDARTSFISDTVRVPATVVLSSEDPRGQLAGAQLTAHLELYTPDDADHLTLADGRAMPLEREPSAALAMSLADSRFWDYEIGALRGSVLEKLRPVSLQAGQPYVEGRIPVVFIHGTASSVGRWADMVNDLNADPEIRRRFHFWYFRYNSGNPIAYSSMQLRQALQKIVHDLAPLDPRGCLNRMVLIGHSQGGLLTKMMAIESGDRFWRGFSDTPIESARLSARSRKLLKDALFVEPLPFVRRVVFIATPHRGSYVAGRDLVLRLARRLIRLPSDLVDLSGELTGLGSDSALSLERIPTSIDNMSPRNDFIQALASIPVAPGIAVNSIIAVRGDGPIESGNDGVVKYKSAHIEPVESEFVVRSDHSTQPNPKTISEVARILHLHAELGCER